MLRALLAVTFLIGAVACSKNDPPKDPLGACAKGQKAYGRIEAAVTMLAGYAPDIPVDSFCMKLRIATKSLEAATDDKGVVGALATKLDEVAKTCTTHGVVRTQQALKDKLAEGRAALDKTCSK
jgi:hypothetical protein